MRSAVSLGTFFFKSHARGAPVQPPGQYTARQGATSAFFAGPFLPLDPNLVFKCQERSGGAAPAATYKSRTWTLLYCVCALLLRPEGHVGQRDTTARQKHVCACCHIKTDVFPNHGWLTNQRYWPFPGELSRVLILTLKRIRIRIFFFFFLGKKDTSLWSFTPQKPKLCWGLYFQKDKTKFRP